VLEGLESGHNNVASLSAFGAQTKIKEQTCLEFRLVGGRFVPLHSSYVSISCTILDSDGKIRIVRFCQCIGIEEPVAKQTEGNSPVYNRQCCELVIFRNS
jgi:hypothetical protein